MRIYLYGIVEAGNNPDCAGVAGMKVYSILHREVAAIVSQIPEGYEVSLEDALRCEAVLRESMKRGAVIPMSFGTIAESPVEIERILRQGCLTLRGELDKLKGKVQVNIAASWNERAALEKILHEDDELSVLSAEIPKGVDYVFKIELGKKVKKALDKRRNEITAEALNALRSLSADFRENRAEDANTLLKGSFLLEKSCEQDFYAKVDVLEKRYGEARFVTVGPLPPYDFAEIEVRSVDFKTLREARRTLGLGEASSISEMRQAFRNLAESCHPDLHADDPESTEKFEKIRRAYDLLTEYCEHSLFSFKKSKVEGTIIVRERAR